ncbi:MAG: DUF3631 domain-containing protein [Gemmatimonadales bacterium]|nr:DUF3631 domain-containing protein [Gemmatimonadales bacterium]
MGAATSPTQLSEALDLADSFLARFVAFPVDEDRHAVALWAAHTHLLDAFASTPRLVLTSPEKQSGKSRCLEVLALLVPEALHAASITPAAMFRRMAGHPRPTVLFDEYDTVWSHRPGESAEELRALINSGHRRGASTWRCVGPTHQVEEFPTFGAVALAGIGRLPDTISDRSITIKMRRRAPGESVEPFNYRHEPAGYEVRDAIAAATERIRDAVEDIQPATTLVDRPADVWMPLLAIAELAGAAWQQRARCSAERHNRADESDDSLGLELLRDIRTIWPNAEPSLAVAKLLELLCIDPERRWNEYRGKALTARGLAQLLQPYEIRSDRTATVRLYHRQSFVDPWNRYLSGLTSPSQPSDGTAR